MSRISFAAKQNCVLRMSKQLFVGKYLQLMWWLSANEKKEKMQLSGVHLGP